MKLELEGDWAEIQEICRRIGNVSNDSSSNIAGGRAVNLEGVLISHKKHFDEELAGVIRNRGFLSAVKLHRERTGSSLKASKEYCDDLNAQIEGKKS